MTHAPPGHYLSREQDLRALLLGAGVRPTQQRLALARLLFGAAHRHATAGALHLEAAQRGCQVSMATVYNTLGQLVAAGLLREVQVDNDCTYYDTNTEPHCHVFDLDSGVLEDAPLPPVSPPPGVHPDEVLGIDLIFRVRRQPST